MHILHIIAILILSHYGSANILIRNIKAYNDDSWSYSGDNGPEYWPGVCNSGKKQSPVDIHDDRKALNGPSLSFEGAYKNYTIWIAMWNGHINVVSTLDPSVKSTLKDGSLGDEYIFNSLHIHFGSEHTVNGKRYAAEVHLVHYNSKFTFEEALQQPDGLAVIAILLDEDENANRTPMSQFLKGIVDEEGFIEGNEEIGVMALYPLFPNPIEPWVRYTGSLTTPSCQENVKWTVLLNPISIPTKVLKDLKKTAPKACRPIQQLNNRTLYEQNSNIDNEINTIDSSASNISFNFLIITLALSNLIID